MADPAWKQNLRAASFRGVPFKTDVAGSTGGRRGVNYEFPKRDDIEDEDMGRRSNRKALSCYVIGEDYVAQAEALEDAFNAGAGTLILPTLRPKRMRCETYNRTDRRAEGGWAVFDCIFVEAPSSYGAASGTPGENTQGAVLQAADGASAATIQGGTDPNKDKVGPR